MGQIDDLIDTYLSACAVEGKSPNTVFSYRASLAHFRRSGQRLGLPDGLAGYTVPHVYRYLHDLRSRGCTPAYQHRRHREVKAFFSWCKRMEFVGENVFARVPLVKLEQQIVQPYSPEDVQALLASQDRSTHPGCRNYALFLFLLDTGVRASECISVRLDDIDWERCRVRVLHGKGKKQRWVGIGDRTMEALRDYIERFRGDRPEALFLTTRRGEPLTHAHSLHVILRRVASKIGLTKVHPHRFRHTFATWAIRAHAREIDVQSLLGHSSLTMVQRYARTYSSEEAVQAHARFSPVGQLEAVGGAPAPEIIRALPALPPANLTSAGDGVTDVAPKTTRRCDVAIENRDLPAGTRLVATSKGRSFTCAVAESEDGKRSYVIEDGRTFASPSAAGSAVMGGVACNGWRFWSVEGSGPVTRSKRAGRKNSGERPTAHGENHAS